MNEQTAIIHQSLMESARTLVAAACSVKDNGPTKETSAALDAVVSSLMNLRVAP